MNALDSTLREQAEVPRAWVEWYEKVLPLVREGGPDDGGFDGGDGWCDGRHAAYNLGKLIALRVWKGNLSIDRDRLDDIIRRTTAFLLRRQAPDGRIDLSAFYSPNEVGFTLPALAEGWRRLAALPGHPLGDVGDGLKKYLLLGAEAVLAGQAYTANHRWAAAAAPLAAVHALWPDERYLRRIDDYLRDGIDLDRDGCWFEERSPNYNIVANLGLFVLADALKRPEFLDLVRRNLDFCIDFLQPNGEADASFSHRQDRGRSHRKAVGYGQARRMALHTGDGRYTALAELAWNQGDRGLEDDLMPFLFEIERDPRPMPSPVPLPDHFEKMLFDSPRARLRRGRTALTVEADKGNHFFDKVMQKWGGPRLSDDWFHLHHGEIVLQTIHLAGSGMANLQPRELKRLGEGRYELSGLASGWKHTLHFRPGHPVIDMEWNWSHRIEVRAGAKQVELDLRSAAASSLIAALVFWFRPGVEVWDGERALGPVTAGQHLALAGGETVRLRAGADEVRIEGLPPAAHRRLLLHAPSIPSSIATECGALYLGLRFPVDLSFRLVTGSL